MIIWQTFDSFCIKRFTLHRLKAIILSMVFFILFRWRCEKIIECLINNLLSYYLTINLLLWWLKIILNHNTRFALRCRGKIIRRFTDRRLWWWFLELGNFFIDNWKVLFAVWLDSRLHLTGVRRGILERDRTIALVWIEFCNLVSTVLPSLLVRFYGCFDLSSCLRVSIAA